MAKTIEIEVNAVGFGSVKIDGKELKGVRVAEVRCAAGQLTTAKLEILPTELLTVRAENPRIEIIQGKLSPRTPTWRDRMKVRKFAGYDPRNSAL